MKWFKNLVIIISIIIIPFSLMMKNAVIGEENEKTITAMEGKQIADNEAIKWHSDALLVCVGSMGTHDNNGGAIKWYYEFFSPSTTIKENNVTKYERIFVYVLSNQTIDIDIAFRVKSEIGKTITNWSIDSGKATEIAKRNDRIDRYLSKYGDADVGYTLQIIDKFPNRTVWRIGWEYRGSDDPCNAHIIIDAVTSEILEVEADVEDDGGQTPYLGAGIVITVVLMVIMFISIKKHRRTHEKN